ncbi:Hydroxymethylpyrimidine/phosphomethylpyrimidine kinase [Fusobacterium necrogenes]|uniref:pyridoxal kinase n=1 Tax=Fusobacterium necrogenes TaxID=858 RepID=A0A377GX38_9FUSO|nr:pyridoxamine kinase [Fusobacterium necrogenes]STO31121.1 Hydroxymethylpyrimidine/phosphomethylpyrimidine kinase [Fusobacterium necrogenes]
MENLVKKVAAIHDLSGYGRASLTTIIPILSNMKFQVCPVPTAILSTHTGGYEGYSFIDLTDYMQEHIAHWKKLNLRFDCIYSGFLGSAKQIEIVADFIDYFGKKAKFTVVDPVIGDNGKLYSTMNNEMVIGMRKLIGKSDIITPNFTEMMYLLGKEYNENIKIEDVKKYLRELSDMGPRIVVVTSVPDIQSTDLDKKTSVVAYDRENDVFWKVSCKYIPASYPGTGDAYTSVLIGSLLQGDSLPMGIERGVQFITQCIMASYGFKYPDKEGVLLEKMLDVLRVPMIATNYEMLK